MSMKYEISKNNIPFIKTGKGGKILLVFLGGPGNDLPDRFILSFYIKALKKIIKDYTVYFLTRKSNLPKGYKIKNMSDDYAIFIRDNFGSPVDILAVSYGGFIAQYLAVDHPGLINSLILAMTSYKINDFGIEFDRKYSGYVISSKWGRAYSLIAETMHYRFIKKVIYSVIMGIYAFLFLNKKNRLDKNDILIEMEAEKEFNSINLLERINTRTLIVCGDKDVFFDQSSINEMNKMIKGSKLALYRNVSHYALFEKRFSYDLYDFLVMNKS